MHKPKVVEQVVAKARELYGQSRADVPGPGRAERYLAER